MSKVASIAKARRERLLQCEIETALFDFRNHSAVLSLPWMECTDMEGAIEFCRAVDPDVRFIETLSRYSEKSNMWRPDTSYVLSDGRWTAMVPKPIAEPA